MLWDDGWGDGIHCTQNVHAHVMSPTTIVLRCETIKQFVDIFCVSNGHHAFQ